MDVFITKLRKKLKADPSVQIINIRGIGYKLIIKNDQKNNSGSRRALKFLWSMAV